MSATVPQPQALGSNGDPCADCGAPLATDQRYCLECGARRSGPRVDYRRLMQAQSPAPAAAVPEPPSADAPDDEGAKSERDYGPLAAVGGIAVLGLMLLVGVLIGKGDTPPQATAPAPQVVRVGGGEGTSETARSQPTGKSAMPKDKAGGGGTGAKTVDGGLTGTEARKSTATVQATTDDLEALEESTGEDYEETVKKLPDKIATPGAPPPVDKSKAPGGGGSAETFE